MKYVEASNEHRRTATYSERTVLCKKTSPLSPHYKAAPGMMVNFYTEMQDGSRQYAWGRVLGRVDAPKIPVEGKEPIPEVKGYLAVAELSWGGEVVFIRWVDPDRVSEIRECPRAMPAWFYAAELPSIEDVLAADRYGSLSEPYIERWTRERAEKRAAAQKPKRARKAVGS